MEKESLGTLALVVLLLVIIVASVYLRRQQELVAVRPSSNQVVSQLLSGLNTQNLFRRETQ